jgi:hypothetical protein
LTRRSLPIFTRQRVGDPPADHDRIEHIRSAATGDEGRASNVDHAASDIPRSWICAVRKMSEGASVKHLRVEVMACQPTTELLFRQVVGRVSGGGINLESRAPLSWNLARDHPGMPGQFSSEARQDAEAVVLDLWIQAVGRWLLLGQAAVRLVPQCRPQERVLQMVAPDGAPGGIYYHWLRLVSTKSSFLLAPRSASNWLRQRESAGTRRLHETVSVQSDSKRDLGGPVYL